MEAGVFRAASNLMTNWEAVLAEIAQCHSMIAGVESGVRSAKPPTIPSQWTAGVAFSTIVNGTPVPAGTFPFPTLGEPLYVSDGQQKRTAFLFRNLYPWAPLDYVGTPGEWFNVSGLTTDTFGGWQFQDNKYFVQEKPSGGLFRDMFAFVASAEDGGNRTFKGRSVHRWFKKLGPAGFELLVDSAGLPVQLLTDNGQGIQSIIEFTNFTAGCDDSGVWEGFDEESFRTPLLCPAPEGDSVVKTSLYIFHPADDFNIAGQDLGDTTGDTLFTCEDVLSGKPVSVDHAYAWFTKWEVELVPRWGQYQNCNGYPAKCQGANNFWVGRETAMYLGPGDAKARQCGPANRLTGMWLSLPEGGKCSPGHRPGDGSCTWRGRPVKTINGSCVLSRGKAFEAACKASARAPFPQPAVLFLEAFASDDPAQGGCHDIMPSAPAACSWHSGCLGLAGDCCPMADGTSLPCCGAGDSQDTSGQVDLMI